MFKHVRLQAGTLTALSLNARASALTLPTIPTRTGGRAGSACEIGAHYASDKAQAMRAAAPSKKPRPPPMKNAQDGLRWISGWACNNKGPAASARWRARQALSRLGLARLTMHRALYHARGLRQVESTKVLDRVSSGPFKILPRLWPLELEPKWTCSTNMQTDMLTQNVASL